MRTILTYYFQSKAIYTVANPVIIPYSGDSVAIQHDWEVYDLLKVDSRDFQYKHIGSNVILEIAIFLKKI